MTVPLQLLLNRLYTFGNPPLVGGLLIKNHYADRLSATQHRWIDRAVLAVFATLVAGTVWVCMSNVIHPRAWDYPCFYTVARAAVSGKPFYQPEVLKETFRSSLDGSVPDDWFSELNFLYLPPSALVLAPLGLLPYGPSLVLHYLIQAAFLIAAVLLLHRIAPLRRGWRGAVEAMVLFLAFRPVEAAFDVAQLVLAALFFTVVAFRTLPTRPIVAGLALGCGALYKHLLIIVAVLATLLRRVSTTLGFVLAFGVAAALSLWAFGAGAFSDYLAYGPSTRPPTEYVDATNQSLLGALYRLRGTPPADTGVLRSVLYPPFIAVATLLGLATTILCRSRVEDELVTYLRVALVVSVALLVYPNTLYNTVPLILPGLIIAFSFRDRLPAPGWLVAVLVTVVYVAASIPDGGGFTAVLLSWLGLASLLLTMELQPRS